MAFFPKYAGSRDRSVCARTSLPTHTKRKRRRTTAGAHTHENGDTATVCAVRSAIQARRQSNYFEIAEPFKNS